MRLSADVLALPTCSVCVEPGSKTRCSKFFIFFSCSEKRFRFELLIMSEGKGPVLPVCLVLPRAKDRPVSGVVSEVIGRFSRVSLPTKNGRSLNMGNGALRRFCEGDGRSVNG